MGIIESDLFSLLIPVAGIYVTIIVLATQSGRDRARRVRNFSRALKTALAEPTPKCGPGGQNATLSKVETFFEQSNLSSNYRSPVEAIEYLQYRLHADRDEDWTNEERAMVDDLLARLRQKQPFSALEGDARRLRGSVRGHLNEGRAGEEALGELADHMRSMEQKSKRDRRMGFVILGLTLLSIGVSVAAIIASWPQEGPDPALVAPDHATRDAVDSLVVPAE